MILVNISNVVTNIIIISKKIVCKHRFRNANKTKLENTITLMILHFTNFQHTLHDTEIIRRNNFQYSENFFLIALHKFSKREREQIKIFTPNHFHDRTGLCTNIVVIMIVQAFSFIYHCNL